jgi:glycosyltransferase involved in cell wall biosynthesis
LRKLGHEVAIVAPDHRQLDKIKIYSVQLPFMAAFTGHPEYKEAKLYSQLSGAELNDIQSAFADTTIKAVEDFAPDVIHVHHASNLSWIANYVKAVYQIHYIITSHNTDVMNAVLDKRYIPLTQDALNRADLITAVSENTKERLLHIIGKGFPSFYRKTKVVPCGVDVKAFSVDGSIKEVSSRYKISSTDKVALYVGKITTIKGLEYFVNAAKHFPEAKFFIVGGGDEIEKIQKMADSLKTNNIIFTGYLGKEDKKMLSQLYRRANVVVIPSTESEGVPMTALEAMSSSVPVIASNIGGIPTAIKNQKNGILVKPKNSSQLVEAIAYIFNNPQIAKRMGLAGRNIAIKKFDWPVIAKKMEKYYQVAYERSLKNRSSKRPSFVSDQEYLQEKNYLSKTKQAKVMS